MAGRPREWGNTVERGVWHRLWVVVIKTEDNVNRRVLEEEGERAILVQPLCSPLQTTPAAEKGRGTIGQAVADLGPDSYSLLPSFATDPRQVTYPDCASLTVLGI